MPPGEQKGQQVQILGSLLGPKWPQNAALFRPSFLTPHKLSGRSPYAENAIKTNCFLMIFKRPMSTNALFRHQNSNQI